MKATGVVLIAAGLLLGILAIFLAIMANYDYQNNFRSFWDLAEKSSTLEQKSYYLNKFVDALEESGLKGQYDVLFLKTPNNSFDY